jgi:subtilase family serine protease
MRDFLTRALMLGAALILASCAGNSLAPAPQAPAPQAGAPQSAGNITPESVHAEGARWEHVCGPAVPGSFRCHALVRTDLKPDANPHPSTIQGYKPADLLDAYKLSAASKSGGSGQTVAIVDPNDDPNAESDLGVYRAQFGLSACTTANGCFRKVNQAGVQGNYPKASKSGAQEISLDLDMVSAVCPNCHILLVEANSLSSSDLLAAEDTAAALGPNEISNSFGGAEGPGVAALGSHFNHPGIAITASSGDNGFGVQFPADLQYVTAVGGTTLARSTSQARGWVETAWISAGSGCSAFIAKPSWQNFLPGCNGRVVADVSVVADPTTGVAVYDTYPSGGWMVFGGTSVGAPLIAAVYALAGNASTVNYGSFPYLNGSYGSSLFDVLGGSNGSCSPSYLCTAGQGYDGPTGLGTPDGTGAF